MAYLLGEPEKELERHASGAEFVRMRMGQNMVAAQNVLTYLAIPYGLYGLTGSLAAALILGPALAATVRYMYRLLLGLLPGLKPTHTADAPKEEEGRYWERLLYKARQRLRRGQSLLSKRAGQAARLAIIGMLALAVSKPLELALFGAGSRDKIEAWKQQQHQTVTEMTQTRDNDWAERQHRHIEEATLFLERLQWMHQDSPWCLGVTSLVLALFWLPMFFKARVLVSPTYGVWRQSHSQALYQHIVDEVQKLNLERMRTDPDATSLYKAQTDPAPEAKVVIESARLASYFHRSQSEPGPGLAG